MNKFRELVESIVFAGLKPATPGALPRAKKPGIIRRIFDKFLSGGRVNDPLYLSNRSWTKRIIMGAAVVAPIAAVSGVAVYLLLDRQPPKTRPPVEPTLAEIASSTLKLPVDLKIDKNKDLEVIEVRIDNQSNPPVVTGVLRNRSSKMFTSAEISFDLTDDDGSQVGASEMTLHNVMPNASTPFRIALGQRNTAFVVVRNLRGL
jgi:hypothetical protein